VCNQEGLLEYYKEQWEDARELNHLDWRVVTVFGTLISLIEIANLFFPYFIPQLADKDEWFIFIFISSLINTSFASYGILTVAQNQGIMLIRFWIITKIERIWFSDNYDQIIGRAQKDRSTP